MATPDLQAPSPTPEPVRLPDHVPVSRQRKILAGIGLAVVVPLGIWICWMYLFASNTFDMHGRFTTNAPTELSDSCSGSLHPGSAVFVYDTEGVSIATGYVDSGLGEPGYRCTWSFTVPGVPANQSAYVIEIGKYGQITLPEEQAENPALFQKDAS